LKIEDSPSGYAHYTPDGISSLTRNVDVLFRLILKVKLVIIHFKDR